MKKVLLTILSILLILALLSGCGGHKKLNAGDVKAVTALTSLYSSYLYVIEDEGAIKELVDFYNGLKYEKLPEGETPDLLDGDLYTLQFASEYENGAVKGHADTIWVSPKGYVEINDVIYKLTSEFDKDWLESLLEKYDTGSEPVVANSQLSTIAQ